MPDRRLIHVAAGAIEDRAGRILIAQRPAGVHQGGLWEFPGGKLAPLETPAQALARELHEELGIRVIASRPLIQVQHDYGDRRVLLDVRRVSVYAGEPRGLEGQPLDWVRPEAMDPAGFPAADRPIIMSLRLPDSYLITGADPTDTDGFLARLDQALAGGITLAQLRAHALDDARYRRLASAAAALCRERGARLILSRHPALVREVGSAGLHLQAHALRGLRERPLPADRLVGASCHDAGELARAAALGLDYALLSPVRPTRSHPDGRPLGWQRFTELVAPAALPVYALGGLGPADLADAFAHGAQGIAAIRGLWPQGPID